MFKAIDQSTGEYVALKRIKIRKTEDGVPKEFVREMEALQRVLHPNVIKVKEVFVGKANINVVYPLCETDLDQLIKKLQKPLD